MTRLVPSLRTRTVLLAALFAFTTFFVEALPTETPLPRPEALRPQPALALGCADGPAFEGRLTSSSGSTSAITRTTTGNVYGYISDVVDNWSCTAYYRYSGLAWVRDDAQLDGNFDWGNLINSTSVACNWGIGSTDYLKANSTADCPDTDAEYAMPIFMQNTSTAGDLLEAVWHNDGSPDQPGDFAFIHSDCTSYYGKEPIRFNQTWSTSNVNNRPGNNCDPRDLDGTNTTQSIVVDATGPTAAATGQGTNGITIGAGNPAYATGTSVTLYLKATDAVAGLDDMRFSNDGTTWSAWQAYATTKTWALATGDGTKTVRVQFRDQNGNVSTTHSDTIALDTINPTGSISIAGGATYATTLAVTLNLTYADAGSGPYQMQFNNESGAWSGWQAVAATKAWTLSTGDGTKTVNYQVKDNAGRISTTYSDTVVLDTVAPSATIVINDDAPMTSTPAVTLNITASDAESGVAATEASNDDVAFTPVAGPAAPWTLTTGDGMKSVWFRVTDGAGRTTTVSDTIELSTGPSADFVTPDEGTTTAQSAPTYSVSWTETGAGIVSRSLQQQSGTNVSAGTCSGVVWTDDGEPVTSASPSESTGLEDGNCYRWIQTLSDGSQPVSRTSGAVLIDTTVPITAFTSPATSVRQSAGQVLVAWTEADGGAGISGRLLQRERMVVQTDGTCLGFAWSDHDSPSTTAVTPLTVTGLVTGYCYRWVLTVIDSVGNTSWATSPTVLVDWGAPSANFSTPDESTTTLHGASSVEIAWAESDDQTWTAERSLQRERTPATAGICGSAWTPDGAAMTDPSPVTSVGLMTSYCYRWVLSMTDGAGNTGQQTSGILRLGETTLVTPVAGKAIFGHESISADTTLESVTSVEFLVDGLSMASAAILPYATSIDTTTLADGSHQVQVRVTHAGGATVTTPVIPMTVANNLDSVARIESDYASAAIGIDAYVINGVLALLAPNALPIRYRSSNPVESNPDLATYLAHRDDLQQATRDQLDEFLAQPLRGDMYQPTSSYGFTGAGSTGCDNTHTTGAGSGYSAFTVTYCVYDTTHFRFRYVLGTATTEKEVMWQDDGVDGGLAANGYPDLIDKAAAAFEDAYQFYVSELGFDEPIAVGDRIQVTLQHAGPSGDLASKEWFGLGPTVLAVNPASDRLLPYAVPHELFHAFQYGYRDSYLDTGWFERNFWYEGTANWATHRWLTTLSSRDRDTRPWPQQ